MSTPREAFWRNKKGEKTEIKDLEDNHLVNILRMIKRKAVKMAQSVGGKHWRDYTTAGGNRRFYFLEKEVKDRGLVWDPEEDDDGYNTETYSEACIPCVLSLVCKTQKVLARKCHTCGCSFVPMGGGIRTVFVTDKCPRRQRFRRRAYCHECKKESKDP